MTTPNIRELRRQRAHRNEHWPLPVRLLIICAALYGVYVLLGFFVAPGVIKRQLEEKGSAELKRVVTVGRVEFNPVTLSLRVEKLLVVDAEKKPVLGWGSLFVNYQLWSLISREVHFSEIALDGFAASLHVSKDGVLNVADIGSGGNQNTSTTPSDWSLRIEKLSVNRAAIDYKDESHAEPFQTHMGPTTFVLRNFRTSSRTGADGVFTATTETGEDIAWTGRLALAPLRSNGEVRIGRLAVKKYAPFYSELVNFDVLNGLVDLQVPYEFSIENKRPQVKISEASIKVQSLELAERGQTIPLVSLPSIDLAPAAADLQGRTAEIGLVSVTGGKISVVRGLQGINLTRLLPTPKADSPNAGGAPASGPAVPAWSAKIGEVATKDLTVALEDTTTPRTGAAQLTQVAVSVKKFSLNELNAALPLSLQAGIAPGGGQIKVDGTLTVSPLKAEVAYSVEGASLATFSPWVETFVDGQLTQGVASVRGNARVDGGTGGALAVAATATADISSFELVDAGGGAVAQWNSLRVQGAEFTSNPARIGVTEVALVNPRMNVVRAADGSINVAKLLRESAAAPSQPSPPTVSLPPPPAAEPGMFIAVDRLALVNAAISFVDQSVEPNVKTGIDQLSGNVTGITSAAIDRADVNLRGRIAGAAPLTISGKLNVLAPEPALDLKIETANSDLMPVGPYVGKFVGYQLASGALTLDAKAKLANRRLDSGANVIVSDFQLGAATNSPDAPKVPINLALALLKDRDGRIVLDIPVQGSLADPSFKIGSVVSKVIGNLITKAATSPFSLIGAMFGGGKAGEDLAFQDFTAGSAELDDQDRNKLDVVTKALRERPALRLTATGGFDPTADLNVLRERELQHRVRTAVWDQVRQVDTSAGGAENVTITPEGEARVLGEFYRDAFQKPFEQVIGAPTEQGREPEPRKKRFFLFRWFTRDRPEPERPPAPKPAAAPAVPEPLPSVPEMRARLLSALPIGEEELRRLALERAEQVRRYVVEQGQIAPDRVEIAPNAVGPTGARVTLQLK